MSWTVELDRRAAKELSNLDREAQRRLLRLICRIEDARVVVLMLAAGHRRDIYR